MWPELSASALWTSSMIFMPFALAAATVASHTSSVVLPARSGFSWVLTALLTVARPSRHSSRSCVEIGTRSRLIPRRAISRIEASRFEDHSPWKTRSLVLNPNQLAPVSHTGCPARSTIRLPSTCSQSSSVPGTGPGGVVAVGVGVTDGVTDGVTGGVTDGVGVAVRPQATPLSTRSVAGPLSPPEDAVKPNDVLAPAASVPL
jgi:hypothetical protein